MNQMTETRSEWDYSSVSLYLEILAYSVLEALKITVNPTLLFNGRIMRELQKYTLF